MAVQLDVLTALVLRTALVRPVYRPAARPFDALLGLTMDGRGLTSARQAGLIGRNRLVGAVHQVSDDAH